MRLLLFLVNWGNWSSEILNNDSWLLSKSVGEVSLISNCKAHTLLPTTCYISLSLRRWLKVMSLRICYAQELGLYSLIDRNTSNAPSALNLTSSRNFWAGGKSHWLPSAHIFPLRASQEPIILLCKLSSWIACTCTPAMSHTTKGSKPEIWLHTII